MLSPSIITIPRCWFHAMVAEGLLILKVYKDISKDAKLGERKRRKRAPLSKKGFRGQWLLCVISAEDNMAVKVLRFI